MSFTGPEGTYTVDFQPVNEWDGLIDVTIGGIPMEWGVLRADRDEDGRLVLSGMTSGSEELWQDQWWFELRDDQPPIIRYWGDRVRWREDRGVPLAD